MRQTLQDRAGAACVVPFSRDATHIRHNNIFGPASGTFPILARFEQPGVGAFAMFRLFPKNYLLVDQSGYEWGRARTNAATQSQRIFQAHVASLTPPTDDIAHNRPDPARIIPSLTSRPDLREYLIEGSLLFIEELAAHARCLGATSWRELRAKTTPRDVGGWHPAHKGHFRNEPNRNQTTRMTLAMRNLPGKSSQAKYRHFLALPSPPWELPTAEEVTADIVRTVVAPPPDAHFPYWRFASKARYPSEILALCRELGVHSKVEYEECCREDPRGRALACFTLQHQVLQWGGYKALFVRQGSWRGVWRWLMDLNCALPRAWGHSVPHGYKDVPDSYKKKSIPPHEPADGHKKKPDSHKKTAPYEQADAALIEAYLAATKPPFAGEHLLLRPGKGNASYYDDINSLGAALRRLGVNSDATWRKVKRDPHLPSPVTLRRDASTRKGKGVALQHWTNRHNSLSHSRKAQGLPTLTALAFALAMDAPAFELPVLPPLDETR